MAVQPKSEGDHDDEHAYGWARHREPLEEKRADNKNLALGKWLDRASANSGPKIAPGIGTKKSSR